MEVNQETRAKVMAAANQLYERSDRAVMPRVDEVRSLAKVDMNAASTVMKEWRRMQTTTPSVAATSIPDRLRQSYESALATLWSEAQEIANEALKAAQTSWDVERAEADALRDEVSSAYEAQASQLRDALAKINDLSALLEQASVKSAEDAQILAVVTRERDEALTRAALAEQKAHDLEARVADLKGECDRAYADSNRLRTERDEADLQIRSAQARVDQAKEDAANLRGKNEALQAQIASLMTLLGDRLPDTPSPSSSGAKGGSKKGGQS